MVAFSAKELMNYPIIAPFKATHSDWKRTGFTGTLKQLLQLSFSLRGVVLVTAFYYISCQYCRQFPLKLQSAALFTFSCLKSVKMRQPNV